MGTNATTSEESESEQKMCLSGNNKGSVRNWDMTVDLTETKDIYGRLLVLASVTTGSCSHRGHCSRQTIDIIALVDGMVLLQK